jgi:hypothetical protein
MTTSTATTEFDAREALRQHFEKNGLANFQKSIESLQDIDFYNHVLKKIEQGVDLSIEMPELRKVKSSIARKVIKKLIIDSENSVTSFWESPIKTLSTSIRYTVDDSSLLPKFDVLYKAQAAKGVVKITLKTWRRNLSVAVDGDIATCENIYAQLVMAALRKAN